MRTMQYLLTASVLVVLSLAFIGSPAAAAYDDANAANNQVVDASNDSMSRAREEDIPPEPAPKEDQGRASDASTGGPFDKFSTRIVADRLLSAALARPVPEDSGIPPLSLGRPRIEAPAPVGDVDVDSDVELPGAVEARVGDKWIDVDLSEQKVVAFEGERPVRTFIVSSGLPGTPTVQGTFTIQVKVRSQTMSGGSRAAGSYYSLPNVEWVQYFHGDYSFHGTYWHNNFGRPMSHGCINMSNEDAKWLFEWTDPLWDGKTWQRVGSSDITTLVIIHE